MKEINEKNNLINHEIMSKRSLTEQETSIYIGMSRSFLRQDRMNGFRKNRTPGPPYINLETAFRN